MRWGKPPSAFILGKDRSKWSKWDILIAEAYEIVQRERCSNCGLPIWMCHNDDNIIDFKVKPDKCYARAAVALKESKLKDDDKSPDVRWVPRPEMRDGSDPIVLREAYYRAEAKKHEPETGPI